MYHIQADETHAAATESLCGNVERSMKSQYCVGRQNRFTKSFMGELPLLDQRSPSTSFAHSLPVFFFFFLLVVIRHQSAENVVLIQSVNDVTTVFKWPFFQRGEEGG